MNQQAFLHIPDSQYCYPEDQKTVRLRLRVSAEDLFDSVSVVYGNKYTYHLKREEAALEKVFDDGVFCYYEVLLHLNDVRLVYVFKLTNGNQTCYFCEDGVSGTYDFSTAYYNAFQLPYINEADIMPVVEWMPNAVFYNIFVDRFCRPDNKKNSGYINLRWGDIPNPKSFAGGDLRGITEKLEYLQQLGVTAIYLTPVFCSISNHKYDIYDYYEIDPQFGTKEELRELVQRAHARGIRVVLDAVFNHCSDRLAQFKDVAEKGRKSEFFHWFIIDGDKPSAEKRNYQCFSYCSYMPKFNTSDPQVQKFLIDVATYWIREFDIDGWRLDVSDEVSHDFWRSFRKAVKYCKKDCVIIGENWHNARPYLEGDQYDGIMNYALTKALLDFFVNRTADAKGLAQKLSALYVRNSVPVNSMMMNLLDSHDTHRFYSLTGRDEDKLICALAIVYMHPGAAGIYYGTEVPLEGGYDPDCRRTMDWKAVRKQPVVYRILRELGAMRRDEIFRQGNVKYGSSGSAFILERSYRGRTMRLTVSSGETVVSAAEGKLICSHNYEGGILKNTAFKIEEIEK